ncbi:hypothetical protein [uncultured Bifidobacterium sp.]|uniref:hypothetical protein n=1 Tax=uncultured Bifidobacterium sp. TaxID=165187 RepID=UPI00258DCC81|nr:hypothetical protein [uncultured Bifidobacterium sp.]
MMHSFTAADGRTAYAIGDKKKGGSVSWTKYASGDDSKTGLAGSSWTLTKTDASTATSWTVNDNTTAATGITLTQGDTTVNAVNVNSLTVTSDGSTVAKASGGADKPVSAEADVKMFVNKTQLFQATVDPRTPWQPAGPRWIPTSSR